MSANLFVARAMRKLSRAANRFGAEAKSRGVSLRLKDAGLAHAEGIPTHATKAELHTLYELASSLRRGAKALEIGSYVGASTCFIAAGLKAAGGHLYCVDTWQNETMKKEGARDTFAEFRKNTAGVAGAITAVRKRSDEIVDGDVPGELEFVFIDGDHSYEGAKGDFTLIEDRMSENGIVAFHDCLWFSGVSRVMGEAVASGRWVMAGCIDNLGWIRRAPKGQR